MHNCHDTPPSAADGVADAGTASRVWVRRGLILLLVALSACGTARSPAPIERRGPVPSSADRVVPAPPVVTLPPAPATQAGSNNEPPAEAAPIRSGRLESHPLGGTLALPSTPPPPAASGDIRQTPNGLKRPYVESEMPRSGASTAVPGKRAIEPEVATSERGNGQFAWPVRGKIVQQFSDATSMGIAIAAPEGTPVLAVAPGKVIFSGRGPRSYGNLVIVKHPDELLSVYAHNSKLLVKEGQTVKRGQKIAEVGSSGADGARLGFEVRRQGKPIDPMSFLGK